MLKIYNTASRKKEVFTPLDPNKVTMYNCGLTVYDRAHIGNLRSFTMADIIRRTLEYLGYKVIQVQNFTDVGHETLTDEQKAKLSQATQSSIEITDTDVGIDRLEKTARRTGMTPWEVAEHYISLAMQDYQAMNFLEPAYRPRATEHIKEQQDLILKLLEKGYAYITSSAIYYDTNKFEKYWNFAGQKAEDKKVGVRAEIEVDPEKRNPSDFRLWQFNRPDHAMQWDFIIDGVNYRGYPGWHIECSAMAHKYLGHPIDIHTGGADHIAVHHPNEIAQSEPIYGEPYVKYWYHNAFLTVDDKKMGKSLGNAYNLDDIRSKGFDPMDLRYFYLTADFRTPQNFTWQSLKASQLARRKIIRTIKELRQFVSENGDNLNEIATEYVEKFKCAIEDSFNMPKAVSVLWEVINSKINAKQKLYLIYDFDRVFGLKLSETKSDIIDPDTHKKLLAIIEKRDKAKSKKDFKQADELREQARNLGFELIDTPEGTKYQQII